MTFDLLFKNARVVDGSGNPWRRLDVGVEGTHVTAVAPSLDLSAVEVIDVGDHYLTPGFIDLHVHGDLQILLDPGWGCEVAQGVTTILVGQDGMGVAPVNPSTAAVLAAQLRAWNGPSDPAKWGWRSLGDYLGEIEKAAPALNVAMMAPHGTIRLLAMGEAARPAEPAEIVDMRRIVRECMEDGAFGLSAGLAYTPGTFANDDEVVALCAATARYGGFYQPHHRDYGYGAMQGYRDCIEIGRRAEVAVHLTHAHLSFRPNEGRADELIEMIDAARSDGRDVTLDSYPYLAGSTYLHAFVPSWAQAGGYDAMAQRLHDGALRERIRKELEESGSDGLGGIPIDWDTLVVSGASKPENSNFVGRSVGEIARAASRPPFDVYCDVVIAEGGGAGCLLFCGIEANVRRIMSHAAHIPASDGLVVGAQPHPRAWGTFARYITEYSKNLGLIRLEEMIRKMTSAPAQRLGLSDRGLIRPGMAADLVVIDLESLTDRATYTTPRTHPDGVVHVLVNGAFAMRNGVLTASRAGQVLRRGKVTPTA
ncbi:MAG: N-acyl-D-amino-acid deacylase family protein [Candidatus Dormibacteraceae bacterium]